MVRRSEKVIGGSRLLEEQEMTGEIINNVRDDVGTGTLFSIRYLSALHTTRSESLEASSQEKVLHNLRHNTSETSALSHHFQSKCQQATSERAEHFAISTCQSPTVKTLHHEDRLMKGFLHCGRNC
jgi:hypothetical protein